MYSFPLTEDEVIIKKALANLEVDHHVFNGAFYLTNNRLVFVGYLLDLNNKYMGEMSLVHIDKIICKKSLYVIPNVLQIESIHDLIWKVVVDQRNDWYQAIQEEIEKTHQ